PDQAMVADRRAGDVDRRRGDVRRHDDVVDPHEPESEELEADWPPRPARPEPELAMDIAETFDEPVERWLGRGCVEIPEHDRREALPDQGVNPVPDRDQVRVPPGRVDAERDLGRPDRVELRVERMGTPHRGPLAPPETDRC